MAKNIGSSTFKSRLVATLSTTALAFVMTAAVHAADKNDRIEFEIETQALQSALLAYSEQAGVQLILAVNTSGLELKKPLSGKYDSRSALELLLLGTELEFHFTSENTVTIRKKSLPRPANKTTVQTGSADLKDDSVPAAAIEEIILVGTRSKGRTALETPVPVDVITATAMSDTGYTEVGRMLQALAPSFNFSSSSVSDGTDALRPATLRGLGPDQTLVLVNGKRRHTTSLVHVNTSVGRGAAGVDMNAIPAAGLARIEVLRDGAAAQYGSDAIAGVINLVLKEGAKGGEATVSYGETYAGDGATFVGSANLGFQLGKGGFLNVSAEYRDRGDTNRAGLSGYVQYPLLDNGGGCDAADNSGCDPREFTFDRKNFRIGDAESESKAFVVNAALPLRETLQFYAFATFSERQSQSAGFYRRANQFDRTVLALYPDGFLPLINTDIVDYSLSGGLEWSSGNGWDLDLSVTHGANSFKFIISNSLNASFGGDSLTKADAGTLGIQQTTVNLDAVKTLDIGGSETSIALGSEYRGENYTLEAGEPISYLDGGQFNTDCPGCDLNPVAYSSGFQVFRGFSPANEVDAKRHNFSFYIDVESQISERWLIAAAGRVEDYSDFGSTVTGKISTRFAVNEYFALRGSAATGFRAPSLQQKNFNSVSTQFVEIDGVTVPQERGTFSNNSLVAQLAGAPELKEETSLSFSLGFVAGIDAFTLTTDYYHIQIDDRIGISGAIDLQQPGFENVGGAASSGQFFVNAADTTTNGIDIVAAYDVDLPRGQTLRFSAAGNWTKTSVDAGSIVSAIGGVDVGPLFTPQDVSIIEEWQPKSRMNFSVNYAWADFSLVARLSQFGNYTVCEGACDTDNNIQTYSAKWLTDLQVNYTFGETGMKLSVGANNLFDVVPDLNRIGQSRGGDILGIVSSPGVFQYSRRSAPFGFNGGYWYARASYQF